MLQHLEVLIDTAPDLPATEGVQYVGISDLQPGMKLAADLRTSSGIKLLSEGATVTSRTIELLKQRHKADPLIEAAVVHV